LLFGVVLTLLPLILSWLRRLDSDRPHDLVSVCANGELLLISTVIAGGAVGELILRSVDRRWLSFKIWAVGSAILMLAIEAGWYSSVASRVGTADQADESTSRIRLDDRFRTHSPGERRVRVPERNRGRSLMDKLWLLTVAAAALSTVAAALAAARALRDTRNRRVAAHAPGGRASSVGR
jgi:hypothetical protein